MAELRLNYGNWVRKRVLLVLGIATLAVGALDLIPAGVVYHVIMTIVFVLFLVTFLLPLYAYFAFSQSGGGFQAKLYDCIVRSLGPDRSGNIWTSAPGTAYSRCRWPCAIRRPKSSASISGAPIGNTPRRIASRTRGSRKSQTAFAFSRATLRHWSSARILSTARSAT